MYNWYLLSRQSFNVHTAQVAYILYIALPLTNPISTYLAPSSCDGNVHLSPRLLVNCPLLSPVAPVHPSPSNFHPLWAFPGPNVLLIRTHPNPFPSERNSSVQRKIMWVKSGVHSWAWASDCGPGPYFVILVGHFLTISIFPFPVSTANS